MDAYLKQWEILYEAWQMDNFFQVEGEQWVRHGQWRGTSRCGHATKWFLPRSTKQFRKWNLPLVWLGTVSRSLAHQTMDSLVASLHACHFPYLTIQCNCLLIGYIDSTQTFLIVSKLQYGENWVDQSDTSEWWHCTLLHFEHLLWVYLLCAYI